MYSKKVLIIGSSRGKRSLDQQQSTPMSLIEVGGSRALEWNLKAFEHHSVLRENITFIGGYHIEKIVGLYPDLKIFFNPDWANGDIAVALKYAPSFAQDTFYLCTDRIIFREAALGILDGVTADIVIASYREEAGSIEILLPLIKFSEAAAAWFYDFTEKSELTGDYLSTLYVSAEAAGLRVAAVDVDSEISTLRDSLSLSKFIFGSKSQTLERLRPMTLYSTVLKQIRGTVQQWFENPDYIIALAQILMENLRAEMLQNSDITQPPKVVVRSSCTLEDTWQSTQAGRFESVLNISVDNVEQLREAINTVVESYRDSSEAEYNPDDEFFIQPHLSNVKLCGVCFTQEQQSGAPYYILSFDRSGKTDVVTSGAEGITYTRILWKESQVEEDSDTALIIKAVREVETLFGYDRLDIEFALTTAGRVYILQVRPLAGISDDEEILGSDFKAELDNISSFLANYNKSTTEMLGNTTVLGNMPDWNPAEMIGRFPRPLATSLYRCLITNTVWARARHVMGYRDLSSTPLLLSLSSQPYIDMRASFNSFIPAELVDAEAEELVDIYIEHVKQMPELHDKIEFEVAVTCCDFMMDEHRQRLSERGAKIETIDNLFIALRRNTAKFIKFELASIHYYNDLLGKLSSKCKQIISGVSSAADIPNALHQLVNCCIKYGTFPFSVQARHGFVAMTLLRTLKARGVFNEDEYAACLQSIPTIASDISAAISRLNKDNGYREEFISLFGHLRPSSYDILSLNYGMMVENGAFTTAEKVSGVEEVRNENSIDNIFNMKESIIKNLLTAVGLEVEPVELVTYIKAAIPARENGKFEFMKAVNGILELVAEFGVACDLNREELSFVAIEQLLELRSNSASLAFLARLNSQIAFEQKRHTLSGAIKLPHIITGENDLYSFMLQSGKPNFITTKVVQETLLILERNTLAEEIDNKIVYIESADPGYDWIFSRNIKGLITMYGGAASHMAIRAAEFSLPSAIGCGAVIAESLAVAKVVELNCNEQLIKVIH